MCPHLLHFSTLITQVTVIYEEKTGPSDCNFSNLFTEFHRISFRGFHVDLGSQDGFFPHPAAFPKRSFPPPTLDSSSWATGWNAPWLGGDRSTYLQSFYLWQGWFEHPELYSWQSKTAIWNTAQLKWRSLFQNLTIDGILQCSHVSCTLLVLYDQGVAFWVGTSITNCPPLLI